MKRLSTKGSKLKLSLQSIQPSQSGNFKKLFIAMSYLKLLCWYLDIVSRPPKTYTVPPGKAVVAGR